MAYSLPASSITPLEGIDFTAVYDAISDTTPETPGLPFVAGARADGRNGSEYVFVTASAAITAGQVVGISETAWTAAALTKALADAGNEIAVAGVAIASGKSGWVQTKGRAPAVTLKNGCLPAVPLYTTASAGMLDDTSASQTRIYGIRAQSTAGSSGASIVCWISNLTV